MSPEEFKAARKQLGLTVRDMAAALRLSEANGYRTVRRMESGEIEVSGPISVAVEAMLSGYVWIDEDDDGRDFEESL